jgi:hypothetical protein
MLYSNCRDCIVDQISYIALLLLLLATAGTSHAQEKCIRLLFTTKDLSQVKAYCWRQWTKVLANRAGIADFIFQKVLQQPITGSVQTVHG